MRSRQPVFSSGVLIDSSAYFAFVDRDDVFRAAAQAIFTGLAKRRVRLFTTSFILAEAHALILNRLNRPVATQFLHDTLEGSTTLVWVTPADVRRASEIIAQYDDKDFSLTDATSFAVMGRLGMSHAFSFDGHFPQYGLTVLTPDSF